MRATSLTVGSAALAAALLLTACGGGDGGEGDDDGQDTSACVLDEVGLEVGPANAAPLAGDTGNIPVTVTNKGADCVLDGFPTVGLQADATSANVTEDEAAQVRELTLAEGTAATFTITYVRGEAGVGGSLDATRVKIGLPGDSATRGFAWSYGPVALGAGGVPDASVGAFQQAGD